MEFLSLELSLSVLASVVSVLAFYVAMKSYADKHTHKILYDTLELIKEWDTVTLPSRAAITRLQDVYPNSSPDVIAWQAIEEHRRAEIELIRRRDVPDGTPIITDHINVVLNYMGRVAIAINMNIVDEDYIREDLQQTFIRWFTALGEYRTRFDIPGTMRIQNPWYHATEMIESWKKEGAPSVNRRRRVGSPFSNVGGVAQQS